MRSRAMVPLLANLTLDRKSSMPLHRQLSDGMRGLVRSGVFAPGMRLPSTRALSQELGISRTTVRNVFEQLTAEGYLVGTVGSGTRVSSALPESQLQVRSSRRRRSPGQREPRLSRRGRKLLRRISQKPMNLGIGVPFEACLPGLDEFPHKIWDRLQTRRHRTPNADLMTHGDPAGYQPLRVAISDYIQTARAVDCSSDRVIVLNQWLQGIELASQLLLDRDDQVWIEDPGFPGAELQFHGNGATTVRVPVDDEGLNVAKGKRLAPAARLAYVHPSHQLPLGVSMSLARRFELLSWARETDAWIMEDDFGCEFRYSGQPFPSLQGLCTDDRVIYIGTFNTVLFTSLRVAYLVVPDVLVDPMLKTFNALGQHSASVEQAVLADFIAEGHFTRHIRRMRKLYADRQTAMVEAVTQHLGGLVDIEPDDAGMHLVGWLPDGVDDVAISKIAFERTGIHLTPISNFYTNTPRRCGLLFGYTNFTPKQISNHVRRLGRELGNAGFVN